MKNSQLDSTELGETLRMSRCENFFEVIDQSFICMEHHKRIELVCLDDYYKICVNCALFGSHKHHNVRNLDVYISVIILGCSVRNSTKSRGECSFDVANVNKSKNSKTAAYK